MQVLYLINLLTLKLTAYFLMFFLLCREGDNYGARFIAFFNPHESGNHTFFITSDDEGGAWLAQGNNVTNANR